MTRTGRRGADILLAFPALLVAVMFGAVFGAGTRAAQHRRHGNAVVMNQGDIVESGGTEQVYEHPHHEYSRTLVGASKSLRAETVAREAALQH
ncbi:hypothetical protein [Paenarthrobacter sp. PH39-S1]|uniref:hypothetical protein n=1 Tax=Paenarthrobacter sp. PH39-S1 TaxID=3046204 RepID=UPI0024B97EA5|nr:hypothetical protein [Paenarthrobacter sp. PH39-S1]MDJ0355674.1 hypothetical protein [Paenarthrobacter sp. PH39-S1]